MIRLQRVTLPSLHRYLGLGAELIAKQHRGDKEVNWATEESVKTPGEAEVDTDTEQCLPHQPLGPPAAA